MIELAIVLFCHRLVGEKQTGHNNTIHTKRTVNGVTVLHIKISVYFEIANFKTVGRAYA